MIPPAKRGDRLTQDYVNRIVEQANAGSRLSMNRFLLASGHGGNILSPSPAREYFFEPSHLVTVVNSGTTTIQAFTAAHIIGTMDDNNLPPYSTDIINSRLLKVQSYPTSMHRRNHGVIAYDMIGPGQVGRAYIDGLCLSKITASSRRFLTFAGWKILWEENSAEVASNIEHWAIVRYCGELGFWALLTAATLVANNRWKYSWTEKEWTMSGTILDYTTPALPRVGPFTDDTVGSTGYAWNSTEMINTDLDTGAGWSDDVQTTFDTFGLPIVLNFEAINPIGTTNTGAEKFPVVWLEPLRLLSSGQIAYLFAGWNTPRIYFSGS